MPKKQSRHDVDRKHSIRWSNASETNIYAGLVLWMLPLEEHENEQK